jgi:hypothetical protein
MTEYRYSIEFSRDLTNEQENQLLAELGWALIPLIGAERLDYKLENLSAKLSGLKEAG